MWTDKGNRRPPCAARQSNYSAELAAEPEQPEARWYAKGFLVAVECHALRSATVYHPQAMHAELCPAGRVCEPVCGAVGGCPRKFAGCGTRASPPAPSCCCTDVADNQLTGSPAGVGANRGIISASAWDIIQGRYSWSGEDT